MVSPADAQKCGKLLSRSCLLLQLCCDNIMWRGTGTFPFFVHDPYSSSTAFTKGESQRKSYQGRRFVGQRHPYARGRAVSATGYGPGSGGTVYTPSVEYPVGIFSQTVQQNMKGVGPASEGIKLNKNSDPRFGTGSGLVGATSHHDQPVPSCPGEWDNQRELGGNLTSTSHRVAADHKLIVDSPSTSQSQRSNQAQVSRGTATGTDPKLAQTQGNNKGQGRGRGNRTTVQQRKPGQDKGNSHHMQHSKGRGRGEFRKNKGNTQQKQKARGRGRGHGSGGHTKIQNEPGGNKGNAQQLQHTMGRGRGADGVRHQNKPESHYTKPESDHTKPKDCQAESLLGNPTLQHNNALLCRDKKQDLHETKEDLKYCSETGSAASSQGICYSEPGSSKGGGSRREPAGFGRGKAVTRELQHATQAHGPQGMNKSQLCDNIPASCSKSEKKETVSTLSVNPDLATQEQIGTTCTDTLAQRSRPPMDMSCTPYTHTPQAKPAVNIITEPCFQSQMQIGRSWSYCQKANEGNGFAFNVVSYNLLADQLLKDNCTLYSGYPAWLLDWEYRKKNLLKEILDFRADILCLQEVQLEHYYQWFQPNLERAGYHGIFKKRTRDKPDGCATFFKVTKFSLVQSKLIEFRKREVAILDRDNVALATLLQPKVQNHPQTSQGHAGKVEPGDNLLCVANTHLLFNMNRGDIKLLQLAVLFAELDQLAHRPSHNQVPPDHGQASDMKTYADYPVILCGDFNSQPFSPLYSFVTHGVIQYAGMSRTAISGQNKPQFSYNKGLILHKNLIPKGLKITDRCQWYGSEVNLPNENADSAPVSRNSRCLLHDFNLHSVYRHYIPNRQPEVTTCHNMVCCTVDYIFYSQPSSQDGKHDNTSSPGNSYAQLELTGMLNLLGRNQLANSGGLPNRFLSSDHFALVASFVLRS